MTVNKQTVWLVTMLTLMVVLSAYYIVTGPVEPATGIKVKQTEKNVDVSLKEVQPSEGATPKEEKTEETAKIAAAGNQFFLGYQLQRSTIRSKLTEDCTNTLADPDATPANHEQASKKLNELMQSEQRENALEEMIRKEGFHDAVVLTNDTQVDVVVQSDKLTSAQAVKLITLVKQQFNVPSTNISVASRP